MEATAPPGPGLIASHSGLRERVRAALTPELAGRTVGGLVELLKARGLPLSLAVARDERPSGVAIAVEVVRLTARHGVEVVDLGALSSPAVKLAARRRGLGGAVIVTGSHLAPELTGLKLVTAPDYHPFDMRELPLANGRPPSGPTGKVQSELGAAGEHVAAVCASVEAELIRAAGLVAGCSGGAGPGARLLLEALGCPPTSDRADLTLRLDADGDRLELIDERGVALDPEITFALVVLALEACTVVKGADTSRMVDDLVTERGGDVHEVPPGEVHLLEGLAAHQADVAGEGNGGVVVPAVGPARDGLAAAAAILALMARTGERLSALASVLPAYARRRSTVPCPDPATAYPTLEALGRRLRAERPADPESGVRIERADGAWGLIRRSATEPVLRVTAEARTEAAAEALHAELHEALTGDYHAH